MNGDLILAEAGERLSEFVRGRTGSTPIPIPFEVSSWTALSLVQKAIRRGRVELAWRAAATLLREDPDRLWRRLLIIASEDVGVGRLETLSLAVAAGSGKRFRKALGGDWAVASALIEQMAISPKCRATDDLAMIVQHHPSLAVARDEYAYLTVPDLLRIASSNGGIPERGLATWLALGTTRCPSDQLPMTHGDPDGVFDAFCDAGLPDSVVEVARAGFRRTRQAICAFVPLVSAQPGQDGVEIVSDDCPPDHYIGGVPAWTFDMFVREGRKAMTIFLSCEAKTAGWIREYVPPRERIGFLGNILFAVEGGLLSSRLNWQTGRELRRLAEIQSQGPNCENATEVLDLMRSDLPVLNRVRAHVC